MLRFNKQLNRPHPLSSNQVLQGGCRGREEGAPDGLFALHEVLQLMAHRGTLCIRLLGSTLGEAGMSGKTSVFGARSCRRNWQGMSLNHLLLHSQFEMLQGCWKSQKKCIRSQGSAEVSGETSGSPHPSGTNRCRSHPWPCMGDTESCMGKGKGHFFWRCGCH